MSEGTPHDVRTGPTGREIAASRLPANQPPVRVVIDCDTGVDDTMAVFYGLLAPEVEVVGLTCVWGNISVDLTTKNTLRLLEMLDTPSIPVARGADKPLVYPKWPPPEQPIHGTDGQG